MQNNYDFPVELQPIFLPDGKQIPERQAVVRTDTMKPLGIVSDEYGLVKHADVIDSFRQAGSKYKIQEKISLTNDGAHLFYQMQFPKVEAEIKKGDIIRMMMIAKNSYNGSNSLQVIFGAFRLVCLNGMVIGKQYLSFMFRHIGNVHGIVNNPIDQYQETYKHYIKLFGERTPLITEMARHQLPAGDGLFDKEKVKLPEYLLQEAQTSFESQNDHTVWGYYNSLTFAITHKMRKESPARAIDYGVVAWQQAEHLVN